MTPDADTTSQTSQTDQGESARSDADVWPLARVAATDAVTSRLDLPHPSQPAHAPLQQATARGREQAIDTLQGAFPSLPIRRSTQATDATTLTVGHALPSLLHAIDGEGLLADLFPSHTIRPGLHLKLVRDKHHRDLGDVVVTNPDAYPGGHHRARPAMVAAALDEGYTVVLDGVEMRSPVSMQLAALFERAFGCVININGYLSSRRHTSFGAHWDDQEVVILQLLGRKDWIIQTPAALSMNKAAHGDQVSDNVAWQGRIGPGDAMYVPRGWGHIVNGIDELTFHYTITIPRVNGLRVLESVLHEVTTTRATDRSELEGRPLPLVADATAAAVDLFDVDPAETDRLVRRAVARNRFGVPRRPVGSLRGALAALTAPDLTGMAVMCPCPGGWTVVDPSHPGPGGPGGPGGEFSPLDDELDLTDAVVAGMAGQLVRIPHEHAAAVGALTDGLVHDAGAHDPTIVRALLRLGLLDVPADHHLWGLTPA
ncbi:MAG: hypothetical protein KA758_08240 [Acidimicrobiales bacterium]|nr:hypothetical protein [Acidimicrobiales bacterium]